MTLKFKTTAALTLFLSTLAATRGATAADAAVVTDANAVIATPHYAWENLVGARLTDAMKNNVVTVTPGDCGRIVDAIVGLPKEGGTVQLLAGRYDCANPVAIERDNVRLVGAGIDKTVIRLNDWTSKPLVVIGVMKPKPGTVLPMHKVSNIIVSDMATDGNRANQYTTYLGPDFKECYDADKNIGGPCDMEPDGPGKFIRNNGFTIRGADNVTVQNVRADRSLSGGLVTEKVCKHLLVDNFVSTDSVFDGMAGYQTNESVFRNMVLRDQMFSGISIDLGFSGNVFDHVLLLNNKDNGVFSVSVSNNTFRDVIARGNRNRGFFIAGKNPVDTEPFVAGTCDGNVLFEVLVEGNGGPAIRIDNPCRNNSIIKSVIKKSPGAECISEFPGSQIKILSSQICTDN